MAVKYTINNNTGIHRSVSYAQYCPLFIFFLSFLLYLTGVNPSVPPAGNSGELTITSYSFGIPHPTGYPSYTIFSSPVIRYMPLGNIIYRASIFSAILSAAALSILFLVFLDLTGGRIFVPVVATISLSVVNTFWAQAVLPEIYSFHSLLIVLTLFLMRRILYRFDPRKIFALSFLCGIAMTNHLLFVFVFPFLLVVLFVKSGWPRLKQVNTIIILFFFVLGLSVDLYLPIRSVLDPVIDWGNPETAGNFIKHLSGSQFQSSMFALPFPVILHNISGIIGWIYRELPVVFIPVGLICIRRSAEKIFTVASFFTGVLMLIGIANYDIPDIENYFVSIALFFFIPVIPGIQYVLDLALRFSRPVAFFLVLLLILTEIIVPGSFNYYEQTRRSHYLGMDFGKALFEHVENDGIILTQGDLPNNIMGYLHVIEAYRPDLEFIDTTGNFFTNNQTSKFLRISRDMTGFLQTLVLRDRRPVYLTFWPGISNVYEFPIRQNGLLFHIQREEPSSGDMLYTFPEILPLRNLSSNSISRDPSTRELLCEYFLLQSQWYYQRKCFGTSLRKLERASLAAGNTPHLHARLAFFMERMGWIGEAVKEYKNAITQDPYFPDALNNLASIYCLKWGNLDAAQQYCLRALHSIPNGNVYNNLRIQCLDTLTSIYEWSENYQKAIDTVVELMKLDTSNLSIHKNRKTYIERKMQDKRVIESRNPASEQNPKKIINRATSLHRIGYLPEAIREYEKVITLEPENIYGLNNLAVACFQIGWQKRAADISYGMLEINPDFASAHQMLGMYYESNNQIERALEHFEKMLDIKTTATEKTFAREMVDKLKPLISQPCS